MKIFLIGMMGCGKSVIGKKLSELINIPCFDIDSIIESNENMSINDIFSYRGEDYFRKIEGIRLKSINNNAVVSCGGGIIIDPLNRKYLKKNGLTIYLKTSLSTLELRLKGQDNRPLIDTKNIVGSLSEIYDYRKKFYEDSSDLIIETDNKSIDNICTIILDQLKNEKYLS
jgi:shikimate kinase